VCRQRWLKWQLRGRARAALRCIATLRSVALVRARLAAAHEAMTKLVPDRFARNARGTGGGPGHHKADVTGLTFDPDKLGRRSADFWGRKGQGLEPIRTRIGRAPTFAI